MEAKEKAKELYDKFKKTLGINDMRPQNNEYAIACALIAVDEILASSDHAGGWDDYWQQVKQEINSL